MTLFDEYFTSLRGRRIAVLGLGVSNRPLVKLLLEYGCSVTGCDRTPREKMDAEVLALESQGVTLCLGENYLDDVQADIASLEADVDSDQIGVYTKAHFDLSAPIALTGAHSG